MLTAIGFNPLTVSHGLEALEIFKSHPDIELTLLDLMLSNLDGEHCFNKVREIDPKAKIILSSGNNKSEVLRRFVGKGSAGFFEKPYRR
jgi:CheY-like chemotaxis protein